MTTPHLPLHEKRRILLYLGAHDDALFKWTNENLLRPGKDHVVLIACVPRGGRRRSSTSSTGSFDGVRRRLSLPQAVSIPSTNGSTNSTTSVSDSPIWDDVDEARDALERFGAILTQEHITNEEHVVPGDPREFLPKLARDQDGVKMVIASEPSKKMSIGSSLGEKLAKEVGSQCTIVMVRNPQELGNGIPAMVKEE